MAFVDKMLFRVAHTREQLLHMRRLARWQSHRATADFAVHELEKLYDQIQKMLSNDTNDRENPVDPKESNRFTFDFGAMSVGDQFDIDMDRLASCRASASAFGSRNGMKFIIRKQTDGTAWCRRVL